MFPSVLWSSCSLPLQSSNAPSIITHILVLLLSLHGVAARALVLLRVWRIDLPLPLCSETHEGCLRANPRKWITGQEGEKRRKKNSRKTSNSPPGLWQGIFAIWEARFFFLRFSSSSFRICASSLLKKSRSKRRFSSEIKQAFVIIIITITVFQFFL